MSGAPLFHSGAPVRALVVGGRGAIGGAFVRHLEGLGALGVPVERVVCTSRDQAFLQGHHGHLVSARHLDPSCEKSFTKFVKELKEEKFRPNLIFHTVGLLHSLDAGPGEVKPEVSLSKITSANLLANFNANILTNGLALRFLLGEVADRRAGGVFATLSARIGSISDNRQGGWYSYRASKAAVNMLVRCAAIEARRTHPGWRVVGLHPGTVASALSDPFMRGKARQVEALVRSEEQYEQLVGAAGAGATPYVYWLPEVAAARLYQVMSRVTEEESGLLLDYAGREITP